MNVGDETIGFAVGATFVGVIGYMLWRQSRLRKVENLLKEGEDITGVKVEDLTDIVRGTAGKVLGAGSFQPSSSS